MTRLNGLHFANLTWCGYTSKPSFGLHCTLAKGGSVFWRKHFAEKIACFAMVLTTFKGLLRAHGLRSIFLLGCTCVFLLPPHLPPLPLPAWQHTEVKSMYKSKIFNSTEPLWLWARLLHISSPYWFHLRLWPQKKICNDFSEGYFSWGSCPLSSTILVIEGMVAIDAKLQP